jgi:predicted metal-binding protein
LAIQSLATVTGAMRGAGFSGAPADAQPATSTSAHTNAAKTAQNIIGQLLAAMLHLPAIAFVASQSFYRFLAALSNSGRAVRHSISGAGQVYSGAQAVRRPSGHISGEVTGAMVKKAWKELREIILSHGAQDVRQVDPRQVPTAEWVRLKCQFGCGGYGQCLTCPPHSPTPSQTRRVLDEYCVAFLIYWGRGGAERHALAEMERLVFLKGFYKALALACGPCDLCRRCNTDEPCRHPHLARPAMEACGIDVFQTVRSAGFPIEVVTCEEEQPHYYSLLLVE